MIETGSYCGELEIMMGGNLGKGKFVRFVSIDHQAGSEGDAAVDIFCYLRADPKPNLLSHSNCCAVDTAVVWIRNNFPSKQATSKQIGPLLEAEYFSVIINLLR